MALAVAPARRGRPSAADLSSALERARQVNADLRLELRVRSTEERAFAELVAAEAERLTHLPAAQNPRLVLNVAGALAHATSRRLTQIAPR
jgi:hypothetical protein